MSIDPTKVIASLDVEPTFSAREAAAFLPRSYSWLDQRLRQGHFTLPDGRTVKPMRTSGGYRRFSLAMVRDIAVCSTNAGFFSLEELKFTLRKLLVAAQQQTGTCEIPD